MNMKDVVVGERYKDILVLNEENDINQKGIKFYKCQCVRCGKIFTTRKSQIGKIETCGCGRKGTPRIDLTGQRFGRLTVISPTVAEDGAAAWLCQCDCGNKVIYKARALRQSKTKSCGCLKMDVLHAKAKDLTGMNFGFLTVIKRVENIGSRTAYLCRCQCGKEKVIAALNLTTGKTISCGCYKDKRCGEKFRTHGLTETRLYNVWSGIHFRCGENSKGANRKNYFLRGIRVCDEWSGKNGFQAFHDWAYSHGYDENAPKGRCTIDRIDVNGNYEPSNCRWVSVDIQANNTTKTKYITYRGETLSLGEAASKYCIPRVVLWKRLRRGWDVETAIETPVSNSNKYITIQRKKEGK